MTKIPVAGFLFQSNDSSAEHSHGLYITSWNGMPVHRHPFSGTTSFNDGHSHIIEGTTGPAIELQRGGHIHYFEGYTTVNGRHPHTHHYKGATENEIP
ncbi:MAG TPA: hypothetical protein DCR67_04195 [Brevibacillus sp.]|nr:hypothetical protein [Brevibacillus sp.]